MLWFTSISMLQLRRLMPIRRDVDPRMAIDATSDGVAEDSSDSGASVPRQSGPFKGRNMMEMANWFPRRTHARIACTNRMHACTHAYTHHPGASGV